MKTFNAIQRLFKPLTGQDGALFGVDARIGLVIFTTLSVIAGFYGFSRVKLAKEGALVHDLKDMHFALESYQADMNTFFLFTLDKSSGFVFDEDASRDLTALWDKNQVKPSFQKLWHGPYLHRRSLQHKTYGTFGVHYGQAIRTETCRSNTPCYVWLSLSDVPIDVWKKLNSYIDESKTHTEELPAERGVIQANDIGAARPTLFYRTIERKVN